MATIHHGDCLEVARTIPAETVDLVYADPPFFTQRNHSLTARDRATRYEFEDKWDSMSHYLAFLNVRLLEFRRVLRPTGSIFLHCDTSASHRIRCELDDVFGADMFRSEIIWHYRRWSNSQRGLLPSHQTIFFYTKSESYKFNPLFEGYSPSTNVDQILQKRKRDLAGKAVYLRDEAGNVVNDGCKNGVPLSDVWDIPYLNPKAKERVGYPTQKPILLLERIIQLCTDPGDCVLDPFLGSGTTLVAAELLNRVSIGIDISSDAVTLAGTRLHEPCKTESQLMKRGRSAYAEYDANALKYLFGLRYVPVQRNKGIDALLGVDAGSPPVFIRVQKEHESLVDAAYALLAAGKTKQPATLVLVATGPNNGGLWNDLPPEIIVVNSLPEQLSQRLASFGCHVRKDTATAATPEDALPNLLSETDGVAAVQSLI